jgi:hypothetical protein
MLQRFTMQQLRRPQGGGVRNAQACRPGRATCVHVCAFHRNAKRLKYSALGQSGSGKEPLVITLQPDGSDAWRIEPAVEMLRRGGVRESVQCITQAFSKCPRGVVSVVSLRQHVLVKFTQC